MFANTTPGINVRTRSIAAAADAIAMVVVAVITGVPSARSRTTAPFAQIALPRNPHDCASSCTECRARAVAHTTSTPDSRASSMACAVRGEIVRSDRSRVPSRSVANSRICVTSA
ncbi:hypothetical protein E143388_03929 [Rhodococcus opacus]|nr:hypothetical protein E143388_03929 [Rhodococcus opacus]